MLPDWYLRLSSSSGPAFVAAFSNVDVVVVSLAAFTLCFAIGAATAADWLFDVAFLSLVAGGILVTWPAMVALSIAAVLIAMIVSFLHKWLAPGRAARISAEADQIADSAVSQFKRDLGQR